MIDELTRAVAHTAKLPPAQAALAVKAMLNFFTARLPSRLVGELHACLKNSAASQSYPQYAVSSPPKPSNDQGQ
ncbi:MAG: hypothetical protein JNM60_05790 [Candidatus Competibacteraceae bacterium]|nr:hypothetical protein [Candidatus Competibacteraceae bacterium]